MKYSTAIVILIILFIISLVMMVIFKGDKDVVNRKLLRFCMILFLFSTLFGMFGLLFNEPYNYFSRLGLFLVVGLCYLMYAWWYWSKRQLVDLDREALLRWELPQAIALSFLATAAILNGLWATEVPRYKTDSGVMLLIAPTAFIIIFPLLVIIAYRYWNMIPIVSQFRQPWVLSPLDPQPVIEPTADAKRIYFQVPFKESSKEFATIDVSAPNDEQLKSVFHHILYRYNVLEQRHPKIGIAFENKKDFMFGWLLYRIHSRWYWWDKKIYLDMNAKVRFADVFDGEDIFAERVRPWENKYLK